MTTQPPLPTESAENLAPLVICLIEDLHANCDDWVAWATGELVRREDAPPWLAELTTTYSANDALRLLWSVGGVPTAQDRLGSLWLSFLDRQITSIEILELGLAAAGGWDTGGGFVPYQRDLMDLLKRVEALSSQSAAPAARGTLDAIERDGAALLAPLGDRVRERIAGRLTLSGSSCRRPPVVTP